MIGIDFESAMCSDLSGVDRLPDSTFPLLRCLSRPHVRLGAIGLRVRLVVGVVAVLAQASIPGGNPRLLSAQLAVKLLDSLLVVAGLLL